MQNLVSHPVNGRCSAINSLGYGNEICDCIELRHNMMPPSTY